MPDLNGVSPELAVNDENASNAYWKNITKSLPSAMLQIPGQRPQVHDVWLPTTVEMATADARTHIISESIILVAWGLLLRSYVGGGEVCFGYTATEHPYRKEESTLTPEKAVNLLICQMKVENSDSILNTLQTAEMHYKEALQYINHSLTSGELGLGSSNTSLFNTMVLLRKSDGLEQSRCTDDASSILYPDAHMILSVDNIKTSGITLWHNASYFGSTQALSIARTLENILNFLLSDDSSREIGNMEILPNIDRDRIREWNRSITLPMGLCVHQLVERQAILTPNATAVCSWDGNLSYGDLDRMSTRLGHHLVHQLDVKIESLVGFVFEKSLLAVVTAIAILKSGGICVPLDTRHPQSRLNSTMNDSGVNIALSSSAFGDRISGNTSRKLLVVDNALFAEMPDYFPNEACSAVRPENGAFLMFTSGSTGKPKGILTEHDAFATSCRDHGAAMQITSQSRTFQFSAYSFDSSFSDMFCTFMSGGCVCVPSDHDRLNNLTDSINRLKANVLSITPTVADQLLPEDLKTLKVLVAGGEPLTESIVSKWADRVTLINIYGPTECAVWCIATDRIQISHAASNIGRAVCGRTWIVDSSNYQSLAPVGAIGELLIEGPILARHYHKLPNETRDAFVDAPDWINNTSHGLKRRLYRTGDLVQYCEDGTINYIRRMSTEVKIGGQRVELSGIEHAIKSCLPLGTDVAVSLVKVTAKKPILVSFICLKTIPGDDDLAINKRSIHIIADLKRDLAELLPAYMVPSSIFSTRRIPLTNSGKLDRARLNKIALSLLMEDANGNNHVLNGQKYNFTAQESQLRQLWALSLGVPEAAIKAESNFLSLGDSIAAMKLVGLARRSGLALTVADIYNFPVLSELALRGVQTLGGSGEEQEVVPFVMLKGSANPLRQAMSQCNLQADVIEDIYPCTPLQEGLMALSAKEPGTYLAQYILKLKSTVSTSRYKDAWDHVIQTNGILRSRMFQSDNQILQVVVKERLKWQSVTDLQEYLLDDRKTTIGFGDPLVRLAMVNQNGCPAVVVLTLHHSAYDGWSLPLMYKQVENAYHGLVQNPPPSFSIFIRHLATADRNISEMYWRTQLRDAKALTFPLTSASHGLQPRARSTVGQNLSFAKPAQSEITTSILIRAAWALLICQHCLTDDVVVGTTLSGRNGPVAGVGEMVGPTITTVPVRIRLVASQTVEDFLRQLQDQATEMIPHEHYGLRDISRLGNEGQIACSFQSLLLVQPPNEPSTERLCDFDTAPEEAEEIGTYILTLQVWTEDTGAQVFASYDANIIDGIYVQRLLYQLEHIIKQLCAQPLAFVQDVKAISQHDIHQIRAWTGEGPEFIDRCVNDIFKDRVLENPDAAAVDAWDGAVSYGLLDELSSRLACHLVHLGIGPEITVPLLSEKSLWAQVALLGIIKAGGVFVLLDPDHPVARLQEIVRDVNAKLIVSSVQYAQLCSSFGPSVCTVSKSMIDELPKSPGSPRTNLTPRNALYIHFSSGTTGKPKGTIIEHCSYATSAHATGRAIDLNRTPTSNKRVFHFASQSFDPCIDEMLGTLIRGGCLCIPSDFDRNNNLVVAINRFDCNHATFTPSFGRLISPKDVPGLRAVVLGGECLTDQDVEHWKGVELFNAYGPSETTVTCSVKRSPGINGSDARSLGLAINSAKFYIVEPQNHHQLAPIGGIGELVIDSPTVGRHYLNDPIKTEQAFVERPAWVGRDAVPLDRKLYLTGDLVRYAANGEFIFLGRKDLQVKLRSQRLELPEVEDHIQRILPITSEVVAELVTALDGKSPILIAFVRVEPDDEDIKSFSDDRIALRNDWVKLVREIEIQLAKAVPVYMIPSAYIPLKQIPFTNSRKIDRQALRAMAASLTTDELAAFSAAHKSKRLVSCDLERRMQRLWSVVLGIQPSSIGMDDSFFRLGGDSIDSMKLVSAARGEGLSLTVGNVFRYPRLSEMCMMLSASTSVNDESEVNAYSLLESEDSINYTRNEASQQCQIDINWIEDIYPCTPLQQGLLAVSMKYPGMEMAQSVFPLPRDVDMARFKGAWEAAVRRNAILRTRIIQTKLEALQVVTLEPIPWLSGHNLATYLTDDRRKIMQLGERFCRFAIIEEEKSNLYHFCLSIHHCLYDGWSWNLMIKEVEDIYQGKLLAKFPQFNKFIEYIQAQNSDGKSKDFWKSKFSDLSASSFPKLPSISYMPCANALIRRLVPLSTAVSKDITISNMIRAAWAVIMSAYTENDDVVFGSTVTGRNAAIVGIEGIVGPTFATVPLRVQLDKTQSVDQYLQDLQANFNGMDGFELLGLQAIKQASMEAAMACEFQSIIIVQPQTTDDKRTGILQGQQDREEMSTFNNYGIMLECEPSSESVLINASFDSNVVGKFQMSRILGQFSHVLQQLQLGGALKLIDIEIISPEDYEQIGKWNSDDPEVVHECIHNVIHDQAISSPDAQAICSWDGNMTFSELDQVSDLLAAQLRELGTGPGWTVPLSFAKSRWAIIAMMAVMKTGSAFLLLDPVHHPVQRSSSLIKEVCARVLISDPEYSNVFESIVDSVVVLSPTHAEALLRRNIVAGNDCNPDNALCVLFTSGSTGKPKGIVHTHSGLCSSFKAFGPGLFLDSSSRVLQFAAYAFDASIGDILATLMHGGCVCIPSEHDRMNDLAGSIQRLDANWAQFTPSLGRTIDPSTVPTLKTVVLGGEALLQGDVNLWAEKAHLISAYGPAESSLCIAGTLQNGKRCPPNLGFPLGCRTWVVDILDNNKLCPIGVVGNLVIEGPVNAALGYLNDPERTAASFLDSHAAIEAVCGTRPHRMYNTGDLVRYSSDGSVEFVTRRDTQIKLRGQRIELSDVEFNLHEILAAKGHAVDSAAGMIFINGNSTKTMLAAFVCNEKWCEPSTEPGAEADLNNLHSYMTTTMSSKLPNYMIPSIIIPVKKMPRTTSGKIDRKALSSYAINLGPDRLMAYTRTKRTGEPIKTEPERKLRSLFARCLDLSETDIYADDMFARLGGDSIQAMRLVAMARDEGLSLTVADIFTLPNLSALAISCSSEARSSNMVDPNRISDDLAVDNLSKSPELESIILNYGLNPDKIQDIYPCTPLQEGLMSLSIIRDGSYVAYNVFELPPNLDVVKFKDSWIRTVRLNPILRTRFIQINKLMIQIVIDEDLDWRTGCDLIEDVKKERESIMAFGTPLNRFKLVSDTKTDKTFFLWSSHHGTYDSWSMNIILKQVKDYYKNAMVTEGPKFSSFIKYVLNTNKSSAAYWADQFEFGAPLSFPLLPTTAYQPKGRSSIHSSISLERVTGSNITTSTIVRAAWAILLSQYSNDPRNVLMGTVLSGRSVPVVGVESIAGPTICTVPIAVQIDQSQTTRRFLEVIQHQWLKMIPHEHFGLQNIARLSSGCKAACNFQNLLVIQPTEQGDLQNTDVMGKCIDMDDGSNFYTYALTMQCTIAQSGIHISATFDDKLTEPNHAQRIVNQFSHIISQLYLESSNQIIADLEVISPEDKRELQMIQAETSKAYWQKEFEDWTPQPFPLLPSLEYKPFARSTYQSEIKFDRKRNSQFTNSTLVHAAWALLASQYINSNDVVFGSTLSGHNPSVLSAEDMSSIRNTIPVRVKIDTERSMSGFLQDLQHQSTERIPFEQTGLNKIKIFSQLCQEACNFQSLLKIRDFQEAKSSKEGMYDVDESPTDVESFNQYALFASWSLSHAGAEVVVYFDEEVLDQHQVQRLMRQCGHLLNVLSIEDDRPLKDLKLINEFDFKEIVDLNRNVPILQQICLQDLIKPGFSEPQATAIDSWDGCFSYAELEELSSLLASYLTTLGVGPEDIVPLCFDKSKWVIVAALGVIKSGGAFVFFDPHHPRARLEFNIKNLEAKVILSTKSYKDICGLDVTIQRVILDAELLSGLKMTSKSAVQDIKVQPTNTAYVLMTSGTSGMPKTIAHDHVSVCSSIVAHSKIFGISKTSRVLQIGGLTFDVILTEIFLTLMKGGCICIPSDEHGISGVVDFIELFRVSWAFFTPSVARSIRRDWQKLEKVDSSTLKTLVLGGEQVTITDIQDWEKSVRLLQAYGTSEAQGWIIGDYSDGSQTHSQTGRGVGIVPWIIDSKNQLLPIGAIGELAISGPTVSKGYIKDPASTAKTFVDRIAWLPTSDASRRIYKTGDQARMNSNGTISVFGRIDKQVKLNGQRISLEEIEICLKRILPSFVQVVVEIIKIRGESLTSNLVAFVSIAPSSNGVAINGISTDRVTNGNGEISGDNEIDFRQLVKNAQTQLLTILPSYMVPGIFVPYGTFPINKNGKLQREELRHYGSTLPLRQLLKYTSDESDDDLKKILRPDEEVALGVNAMVVDIISDFDTIYADTLRGRDVVISSTGLDSIAIISLATAVTRTYNVIIPVGKFMLHNLRVRDVAQLIQEAKSSNGHYHSTHLQTKVDLRRFEDGQFKTRMDLRSEFLILDAQLKKGASMLGDGPEILSTVFLTGATGFLGIQILRQLLSHVKVKKVIVLVRADDTREARARILKAAAAARWWSPRLLSSLEVWTGDLAKPRFGLHDDEWNCLNGSTSKLEDRVDAIIHNGAVVHWGLSYERLKAENVLSTLQLLSLLSSSSTLQGFTYVSGGQSGNNNNSLDIGEESSTMNGYSQSKLLSELLVKSYAENYAQPHQNVKILKPGLIVGTRQEGVSNTDDFLWRVAAGAARVGGFSSSEKNSWISVAGVDRVASLIVERCLDSKVDKEIMVSLDYGLYVSKFWEIISTTLGIDLRPMKQLEWIDSLQRDIKSTGKLHPMWPVMHYLEIGDGYIGEENHGLIESQQQAEKEETVSAIQKSVEYLASIGFFSKDEQWACTCSTGTQIFKRSSVLSAVLKGTA